AGKLILGEVAASPPPLPPRRDLLAEMDALKARVDKLDGG
ncbi:hypothetical protein LCGC14_2157670, partial [marine sediment metagenome]